jgi:3-hydroxy-9,10-secoandrosta-1,3,5(10)-triene-9,17-dione monooxygenase
MPARPYGEIVARATELRPLVIELRTETEALGYYPPSLHKRFLDAGLYRLLVPRRYGGLEVDLPTFMRVIIEIARGCPSTAWCLCLAAGHALQVGSWFGERAQEEIFGDGDFRAAAVAAPVGVARRTDDGWELEGTHAYCSGAPYATHYMGQTLAPGEDPDGPPGPPMLFVAPRSEWTMLDDWGDLLGLKGSGSHSIRFERGRIPAHFALEDTFMVEVDVTRGTPGYRLHGNPMYASPALAFFQLELAAIMVGAAQGALDEYERFVTTKKTQRPPIVPRSHDPDYQRWLGGAMARIATAEAASIHTAEEWMEVCERSVEPGGEPFSRYHDLRLNSMAREAYTLAWDAVQGEILRTIGSSATRAGERFEQILRDMLMGWGHFATVVRDWTHRELAREHLGIPATLATP